MSIMFMILHDISTHSLTRRLTILVHITCSNITISTHSLTRRLTYCICHSISNNTYFNSQPHKEADGVVWRKILVVHAFQLTASQGG